MLVDGSHVGGFSTAHSRGADDHWEQFVDAVFADADPSARLRERLRAAFPSHRQVDLDQLELSELGFVLTTALRRRELPGDDARAAWVAAGEAAAQADISAIELLQALRVHEEELRTRARAAAPASRAREAVLLHFSELLGVWSDMANSASSEGYRNMELRMRRTVEFEEAALVRRILFGSVRGSQLRFEADAHGLDLSCGWFAVRVSCASTSPEAVASYFGLATTRSRRGQGALTVVDDDICGFTRSLPTERPPVPVGAAWATSIYELPDAFAQATRAHRTAMALGRTEILNLSETGLYPVVLDESDIGDAMLARYVEPLLDLGESGARILETVERYIENDAQLQVTADELYLHSNTVRYRLNRFEEETDCSLRSTAGLVEVWWSLARYRLRAPAPFAAALAGSTRTLPQL
ncbi:MAG: hypothetical protein JWQ18_591 [Conexibacter sp.]|nr:hypothetical protein [Conexibacter sp.]